MTHNRRAALLTGDRGAGKTSLCMSIIRGDARFSGLLSPPLYNRRGKKCGFEGLCAGSGSTWAFGRIDRDLGGPRKGIYSFSSEGISRAVSCVESSLANCELITVIDEIGPLELIQGEGLAPVLPALETAGPLLIVIRDELISGLTPLLSRHKLRVFKVCVENRDTLAVSIVDFLTDPSGNEDRRRSS